MLKKLLSAIGLFLLTCQITFAQPAIPTDITVLYQQLSHSKADTGRVNLLIKICRYDNAKSALQPVLLDSTLAIAGRAKALAAKLGYSEGTGLSYQLMAQAWCGKKDFKKSDGLIKKAVAIFLTNNLYRDAAEAYLNMEEFYLSAGGKDYKVMIAYYEQALPLFEKSGAMLRAAATLNILGDFYIQLNDFPKSVECLQKALKNYRSAGYANLQNTYNLLGTACLSMNKPKDALKYQLQAVKTAEMVGDTSMDLCAIYNHTGLIYYANSQYKLSDYYFGKALTVAEKYHDRIATVLSTNMASSFLAQKLPLKAIAVLKESEKRFPDMSPEQRTKNDMNYLVAYIGLKNSSQVDFYCDRLIKVYNTAGNNVILKAALLDVMLQYFVYAGKYKMAGKFMPIYQNLTDKLPFRIRFRQRIYRYNYMIDSAQHRYYAALQNYQQYSALKDSLLEVSKTKEMQEIQVQFETEKKEKENSFLRKESILQVNKAKQADRIRNIILTTTFVLLILTSLLFYSYRINQKNSNAINKKNEALNQLVTEKEWLLKEIHHRVKNNLQIVTGLLQRQSAYIDNDEALAAIQNSENRMHAIALIHQKLYQSESLDLIGMPEYIDEMISYLKDSCGLDNRIIFEKHIEYINLDVAQAVPVGLILNEAITNAIKYAYRPDETGTIYITMVNNENMCNQLTIADNGPGLPLGLDLNKVDSLGLNLMRGLVKQLGGSIEFSNELGCTINIIFKTEIFSKAVSRG